MSPDPASLLRVVNAAWPQLSEWQRRKIYVRFRVGLAAGRARRFYTFVALQWLKIVMG